MHIIFILHVRSASARSTSGGKESSMRKTRQVYLNHLLGGDQKDIPDINCLNNCLMQALPCPKCQFETEETKSLSMSTRTHKVVSPKS